MTSSTMPAEWAPPVWIDEADFVVVGYGGAGASFALSAAECGGDVLILEKGEIGGGNSVCCAGALILTSIDDKQSFDYLNWLCSGQTDEDVLWAYIRGLAEIPSFQHKLGLPLKENPQPFRADGFFPEFPDAPGAGGLLGMSVVDAPGGPALYGAIAKTAEAKGARVGYRMNVTRLVQHPVSREILGVFAKNADGNEIAIKARKATVLASGGFEANPEMREQYLTPCPTHFIGSPSLTGDGIKMAQEAGAQLWHMNSVAGPLYWGIKVEGDLVYATYDFMKLAGFGYNAPAFKDAGSLIWVNKYGKRFHTEVSEAAFNRHGFVNRATWLANDANGPEFTNVPAFQIFDEKVRRAGAAMSTLNPRTPAWSADNMIELEKGWIVKADTIEKLAEKCSYPEIPGVSRAGNIDPVELRATIDHYNRNCISGAGDPDFGRPEFLVPLDTPPFYAVGPMFPTYLNTHGGPKHNAEQKVLDKSDQPIPRLYAIGECGSMWGPYYNSMGDITEFMVSGMIAARNALKEEPWC